MANPIDLLSQEEAQALLDSGGNINALPKEVANRMLQVSDQIAEATAPRATDLGSETLNLGKDMFKGWTGTMAGIADLAKMANPEQYVVSKLTNEPSFSELQEQYIGKPRVDDRGFLGKAAVKAAENLVPLPGVGLAATGASALGAGLGGAGTEAVGLPSFLGELLGGGLTGFVPGKIKNITAAEKGISALADDVIKASAAAEVGVAGGAMPTGVQAGEAAIRLGKTAGSNTAVAEKLSLGNSDISKVLSSKLRQVIPDAPASTVQEGVMSVLGSEALSSAETPEAAQAIVRDMIDTTGAQRVQLGELLDQTGLKIKANTKEVGRELKQTAVDESLPTELRQLHEDAMVYLRNLDQGVSPSVALNDLMNLNNLRRDIKPYGLKDEKYGSFLSKLDYQIDALGEAVAKGFDDGLNKFSGKLPEKLKGATFNTLTNQLRSLYTAENVLQAQQKAANLSSRAAERSSIRGGKESSPIVNRNSLLREMVDAYGGGLGKQSGRGAAALAEPSARMSQLRALTSSPEELAALESQFVSPDASLRGSLVDQALRLSAASGSELMPESMPEQPLVPAEQLPVEQQALAMTPEQDMGFDPTLQGIGNIDSSTFYDDKVNVPDQSDLDEKEQNAEQIGTLPRSSAALVNLSEAGKDLSDLGFSEEIAKSAGSLLGGSKEDQRLGLSMLQKDKPSLFEMSPLPGFSSMVDGIIQDDSEKQRIQQKIREALKGDPNRETQALEAVRQNKELPKWSYKYLGGEDQMTFEDKFLQDVEGNRTKAYLDTKGNPTIGTGVNLAAQSIDGLREMNVPEEILQKIAPAIGAKGSRASSILKYNPIELTEEEAMELSKAVKKANYDVLDELVKQDTGASLEDLPIEGKTVLLSMGYNFGSNLKKNKPQLWNAAMSGKWDVVQNLLKTMNPGGEGLKARRLKEAALLNPLVEKKMQLAMNSEVDQPAVDGNVKLSDGTKKTVYRF